MACFYASTRAAVKLRNRTLDTFRKKSVRSDVKYCRLHLMRASITTVTRRKWTFSSHLAILAGFSRAEQFVPVAAMAAAARSSEDCY